MLRLAGREADGAIINWLSAEDVATTVAEVGPGKEIVARIFVCPTEDADRARFVGRMGIAAYLNVAVYAAFHRWLGRCNNIESTQLHSFLSFLMPTRRNFQAIFAKNASPPITNYSHIGSCYSRKKSIFIYTYEITCCLLLFNRHRFSWQITQ